MGKPCRYKVKHPNRGKAEATGKIDVAWWPLPPEKVAAMLIVAWQGGGPNVLVSVDGEKMFAIEALANLTRAVAINLTTMEDVADAGSK